MIEEHGGCIHTCDLDAEAFRHAVTVAGHHEIHQFGCPATGFELVEQGRHGQLGRGLQCAHPQIQDGFSPGAMQGGAENVGAVRDAAALSQVLPRRTAQHTKWRVHVRVRVRVRVGVHGRVLRSMRSACPCMP